MYCYLSRQGEAWKNKIDVGKTPWCVIHFWIYKNLFYRIRAVLACVECLSLLDFRKINMSTLNSLYCRCRLRAVLACAESGSAQFEPNLDFCQFICLTPPSVSLRGVWLGAVLACSESLISRMAPRKQIYQQNHFSQFIRGPGGLDS